MRTIFTFLLFFISPLSLWAALPSSIHFTQNEGQWSADIRYRAEIPSGFLLVTQTGLRYQFYDAASLALRHDQKLTANARLPKVEMTEFSVNFEGANPHTQIIATNRIETQTHFYVGNDVNRWKSNVSAYQTLLFKNIYEGIDLRLFTYGSSLKYEFIAQAHSNVSQIKLHYEGMESLQKNGDDLAISTKFMKLKELKPYTFQKNDTQEVEVKSEFQVENNTARFSFPNDYDHTQTLTIDPVLVFSTFSGLTEDNWGHTATYGLDGSLYAGGTSNFSIDPKTGEENAEVWDVCILKFSAEGKKLLSKTYLGGQYTEVPHSLIVNSKGELLILGTTASDNFPTSANAYDRSFNGGRTITAVTGMDYRGGSDIFVAKLNANGLLMASTYLGGTANDGLNFTRNNLTIRNYGDEYRGEIVVDAQNKVFITSITASADFPVVNAQQINRNGAYDAVVCEFSEDLSALHWSTYLGGTGFDACYSVKVTNANEVYVCGGTNSTDLRNELTANALIDKPQGGDDGFIAKFDKTRKLVNLSYLGTTEPDIAMLMDIDAEGNPHVIGLTAGAYPVSEGVYSNPKSGQFIHALDANLSKTVFSTVMGTGQNVPDIIPTAFLVSECGNIYFSGWGGSTNATITTAFGAKSTTRGLPTTPDATRTTTTGSNFYLAMLEKGAKSLLHATFFGSNSGVVGDHVDGGTCRFDKKGYIYHVACACNRNNAPSDFTTTPGVWSRTNPSPNCNNAAFKFNIDSLSVSFDGYKGTAKNELLGCAPLALRFVNTSVGAKTVEWDFGGLGKATATAETSFTFEKGGEYKITLKGTNPLTCNREAIASRIVRVQTTQFSVVKDQTICTGSSVQLSAGGGKTYRWSPAEGLSDTNIANPVATPKTNTKYSVEIGDDIGCSTQLSVNVSIDESFKPDFSLEKSIDCNKPVVLKLTNNSKFFDRMYFTMGDGDTLKTATPDTYTYKQGGNYTITARAFKGACELSLAKPIQVEEPMYLTNVITPNGDGKNDAFEIGTIRGVKFEVFDRWGKSIYQADDYQNEWGRTMRNGTYFYQIITPTGKPCKGWVAVME